VGWILAAIGGLAVLMGVAIFSDRGPTESMPAALPIGLLLVAFGLYLQARRDLYEVAMFGIIAGFAVGLISAAVWGVGGGDRHPYAPFVTVAMGVCIAVCAVYLVRAGRADPRYPDVLLARYGPNAAELEGVQFVFAGAQGPSVQPGGWIFIAFAVQNTWNAPRTLQFTPFGKDGGLSVPVNPSIQLGPAEVRLLRIPVIASANASGRASLQLDARVEGQGGTRVRNRRVRAFQPRVTGKQQALLLLGGALASGGGLKVQLPVAGPPAASGAAPTAVTSELIWEPGMGAS
jgi:hypothetical protein